MSVVLDASALMATLLDEPGADVVEKRLANSLMTAVNFAEVCTRLHDFGADLEATVARIQNFDVIVVPFDHALAVEAARLRPLTRHAGLSLGDRACLALAIREQATVLTADRVWADLDVGCTIELIR